MTTVYAGLPWWQTTAAIAALVLLQRWHAYRYRSLKHPHSITGIRIDDGQWKVRCDGVWHEAEVKGSYRVTGWWLGGEVRLPALHRTEPFLLCYDSAPQEQIHHLRLLLLLSDFA